VSPDQKQNPRPTEFPELNELLRDLLGHAAATLGPNFVGGYLHGSFANGSFDAHSDCDVLIPVHEPITADQEKVLRALHEEIFDRDAHWNKHLECAYPVLAELSTLDGLGRDWLTVEDGGGELVWSQACNNEIVRWEMVEYGMTIVGPPAASLVEAIEPNTIRAGAWSHARVFLPELQTWSTLDVAWTQRYAVSILSRFLRNFHTGRVSSKLAALEWVETYADPRWAPLVRRARVDRVLGWSDEEVPTQAGAAEETRRFADYVIATMHAGGLPGQRI
jgi:predicted nucleotidyltransferase